MWVKRVLLSLALLGLLHGARSQRGFFVGPPVRDPWSFPSDGDLSPPIQETNCSYIMATPTVLKSGNTGKLCVFVDSEEPVQVKATMEFGANSISVFDEEVDSALFDCRDFPVPNVESATLAYATLTIDGKTVNKNERKPVAMDNMPKSCFFQMEKELFRPGDTVRCRIFCLNYNLKPIEQNFTQVRLFEPSGACVQIVEPQSEQFVATVELDLSDEAAAGGYRLEFDGEGGVSETKYFIVERYMTPRFSTTVTCPSTISVLEESALLGLSAQYVYGKPLPGTVIGKCCRNVAYTYGRQKNCYKGLEDICEEFTAELDEDGHFSKEMLLDTYKLQFAEYDSSIQCTFTTKEEGTGVLETNSCYISISSQPINLNLDYSYSDQYYRHGMGYPFAVTLTDEKGQPLANEVITIAVDEREVKKVTTDAEGRAECAIDTSNYYTPNITVRASYQNEDQCYIPNQSPRWYPSINYNSDPGYPYTEILVYRFFSESDCFVQMKKVKGELSCYQNHTIQVDYKLTDAGVGKDATTASFFYMVTAREGVVLHGQKKVDLPSSKRGSFGIDMYVTAEFSNSLEILVFAPMNTEIISHYQRVSVETCFNNQVSLSFTKAVVEPGSEVQREVTAAPGSICGLRAFDASLNLLRSYNSFNPEMIRNSLSYYHYGYRVQNLDLEDPAPACEDPNKEVYCNGRYFLPTSNPNDGDTYGYLTTMSLMFGSNLRVRKPQVCGMEKVDVPIFRKGPVAFASPLSATAGKVAGEFAADGAAAGGAGSIDTFRNNFAEMFGFDTVITGSDGKAISTSTIPDTITEWNSEVFCLSGAEGVGITNESATILTFLPFFGDMTTAKYATRGEKLIIVTSASNYEEDCKRVVFTLSGSDGSTAISVEDDEAEEFCICQGESVAKQWSMDFTSLGEITITSSAKTTLISDSCDGPNDDSKATRSDTVEKNIFVAPEGIERQVTSSRLYIVNDEEIEKEVDIESPEDLVDDSFKLQLTVVGDLIGLMVDNLDNLLNLPAGCCEQNLAKLLPIVHLLDYLTFTGELDDDLKEKAKSYLSAGYASQLSCRNWDGSYSVYRNSKVVNTWLDIDTYFTFEQMKRYAYIDVSVQQQTLLQVGRTQDLETGCFTPTGSQFTVQDDDDDDDDKKKKRISIRYTAYVVERLQQSDLYGIGETMLSEGLRCIRNADYKNLDTHTFAYVFRVAALAELDIWDEMFEDAKSRVVTKDGLKHWEGEDDGAVRPYYFSSVCSSATVEITSLIMLGIMGGPNKHDEKTLTVLGESATWLSQSQNVRGGFVSSPDTVTATKALCEFGRLVFVPDADAEIVLSRDGNEVTRVTVNKDNKMLVHRIPISVEFGTYKVTVKGKGNPLVQMNAFFNTKGSNEDSSFSLTVTTRSESCRDGVAEVIYADICASYKGSNNESRMVLMDMKALTGYSIDRGVVYNLVNDDVISDYGFKDNHAHFYFKSLVRDKEVCFPVTMFLENHALLYQSSSMYIMDYYNPVDAAFAEYSYPCSPLEVV